MKAISRAKNTYERMNGVKIINEKKRFYSNQIYTFLIV